MLISTILDDLRYGELSAHGMFMTPDLAVTDKSRLIHHINIALTELYTRFPLLTRELTLIQLEGKTLYKLHEENTFEVGEQASYDKYIYNSLDYPFNGDLIRVLGAYDEEGYELRINDSTADCVITTPAVDIVELPAPVDRDAIFIIYQAKHYKITKDTDEVMLPSNFLPALLAYVAHRVYSGGTAQEHAMIANTMFQKYELFCTQQRDYATDNSVDFERNTKPCLGGWV